MTFAARAASVLGYKTLPTSVLALTTYFVILLIFLITNELPAVPESARQGGLNLTEALTDLHHITAYPHPYNSHANDKVHDYILARLEKLAHKYPHVHVTNDIISNNTWYSRELGGSHAEYFEGTNILVKVDGTSNSKRGGVLFSAHYDSVSTARGATDDGMGVVTLMQLVRLFATQRQPRTAVFNINNGEEDGLHGANTFLEHPWSKLTDTFLNLEGAAAGGRPILFRASSETAMEALNNRALVPHPHANVLSSDAFARGLIKSGTDFTVYNGKAGMAGLDLAFYKGRSKYHTKYDSMQYTVGGEKSLWSMMEAARGIGLGLLSAHTSKPQGNDDAVYFDIFKSTMVIFRQKTLLIWNVVLLILGPLVLIMLIFCETIILEAKKLNQYLPNDFYYWRSTRHSTTESESDDDDDRQSLPAEPYRPYNVITLDLGAVHAIWRHAKFWVGLAIIVVLQFLLIRLYTKLNPFAIYSSPYLILFSFVSLAYLTFVHILAFPSSVSYIDLSRFVGQNTLLLPPPQQEKQTIFFHLYGFTWVLLVLGTIGITRVNPGIGGGYLFTAWNVGVTLACVFVGIEGLLTPAENVPPPGEPIGEEELSGEEDNETHSRHNIEETTEATPLWREGGREFGSTSRVAERSVSTDSGVDPVQEETSTGWGGGLETWWWILQFLASVPVPVILFGQIAALLLDSVPQTLADGGAPSRVYALASIPAVLLVLPLAPFAAMLQPCHRLSQFVLAVFVVSTIYALSAFPFSADAPLKIFFRQTVRFNPTSAHALAHTHAHTSSGPTVVTELTGAKHYLPMMLIPTLPSAQGKAVGCIDDTTRPGLVTCSWENHLVPTPGSAGVGAARGAHWAAGEFFEAHAQTKGVGSGTVRVRPRNSRVCRLYFDSGPVEKYVVRRVGGAGHIAKRGQHAFHAAAAAFPNVRELRMSTRTWEQELAVDFSWKPANATAKLRGRVACQWAEYASGMVDTGVGAISNATAFKSTLNTGSAIPAFEEALAYLPEWAVLTKYTDGLVEVSAPFEV